MVVVDVQAGEGGEGTASKVTPLHLGAAALAVPAAAGEPASLEQIPDRPPWPEPMEPAGPDAPTAAVPTVRQDDTLAPGAQLAFGEQQVTLAESGPRSDEFLLGPPTASVPVARSTTRVPPPPPPAAADRAPEKESRGARRRRMGIPRRVTPRVIGFILLVAAVPVATYFVLRWYAYDNWIVTLQGNQIVVKQGQPGGVLWFHPKVVDRTGVTTSQILPVALAPVQAGVQESSLQNAKSYVDNLVTAATTTTTSTTTTTTTTRPFRQPTPFPPPTTTAPTTTAPTTTAPTTTAAP